MARPLGHIATVRYTGTLDDGTVFDTTRGSDPVTFVLGRDEAILGFEDAVMAMDVGDTVDITIPSEKAYGEHHDELVLECSYEEFPNAEHLPVGGTILMPDKDGQLSQAKVVAADGKTVKIDMNHPLAGQTLHFHINLVDLKDPKDLVPKDIKEPGVA